MKRNKKTILIGKDDSPYLVPLTLRQSAVYVDYLRFGCKRELDYIFNLMDLGSRTRKLFDNEIDFGATSRLLLPLVVDYYEFEGNPRNRALKRSLMINDDVALVNGLKRLLNPLPLPQSLSDMGVPRACLKQAAKLAGSDRAIRNGPRKIVQTEVLSMLEAVY